MVLYTSDSTPFPTNPTHSRVSLVLHAAPSGVVGFPFGLHQAPLGHVGPQFALVSLAARVGTVAEGEEVVLGGAAARVAVGPAHSAARVPVVALLLPLTRTVV